jgi:hypothetical protein
MRGGLNSTGELLKIRTQAWFISVYLKSIRDQFADSYPERFSSFSPHSRDS